MTEDRIKIKLPEEFLSAMEGLLSEEFEDFLESYEDKPKKGLFFNLKKARPETMAKLIDEWKLEPVPGTEGWGYIYDGEAVRPGKSPYHDSGLYYIQEPSAMIPVMKADIGPGDRVLDLCAAPGGKSSQIAQLAGLLVANEFIPKRSKILSSNIERMGYDNVIVCNAAPSELSEVFPAYFDKIIVDAPCSGEGMFRKDETAVAEWSLDNVDRCVKRQREILEEALKMLKPGGRIVYSTCTFEPYENKWQLRRFCDIHGDELSLKEFETLYPHSFPGEGQFYGVMEGCMDGESQFRGAMQVSMTDEEAASGAEALSGPEALDTKDDLCVPYARGTQKAIADKNDGINGELSFDDKELKRILNELKQRMKAAGIHVLRCGIEEGQSIVGKHRAKERYEHSHAEAMKVGIPLLEGYADLIDEGLALRYLSGESLRLPDLPEGSHKLCAKEGEELRVLYDGYPLGLAKLSGGVLKNKLPKGLRRLG